METGLRGQVALITGGAGAIGRASALALAGEGVSIAVADVQQDAADAVAAEVRSLGRPALGLAVDTTDAAAVTAMIGRVVEEWGRLDILVNCAGIFQALPLDDISLGDWQRMIDVNLTGMFLCCQAALRVMRPRGRGRLINLGSLAGQVGGLAAGANYAVSKSGVIGLTKAVARAAGASGVTVNTINPGPVESPMVEAWPPGQRERQLANIPLGRLGRPQDIAGAIVFLASDAASYIHGAHLDINGGLHMD